ncbi:DUF1090 family protein [Pseudomonas faucium]|uniref:DUF1090 family protein n=1 Tax=Pseudomonas faucium TaxID=2740518 RepID=UPI001596A87E|nr:DUF1090 family protein [Pseudomonas faucium]
MLRIFLKSMVVFLAGCNLSFAENMQSCKQQKDNIVYEMDQAKRHGNVYKQRGLESALYRVERYCHGDEPGQGMEQLSSALKDVHRRENQLGAAIESGSPRLIEKYKKKLAEARERLANVSEKEM